jgi:hypothetical protein
MILTGLKNDDCAKLLGGLAQASKLANRFNVFDVRNSAPPANNQAEFAAWQFTMSHMAASTAPFSITGNIYVNIAFWDVSTRVQATIVFHELRHQESGQIGEPPWGTRRYTDFIKREYAQIQKNCFPKAKSK